MVEIDRRSPIRRIAQRVLCGVWMALAIVLLAGPASADSNWDTLIWDVDVWAVPEPDSEWMLTSGAAALAWLHFRRRQSAVRSE